MKLIKYIFFFILFVVLHYIEGFPDVDGFSVAQLWKIPLLLFLILYFILHIRKTEKFEKWTMLLILESFFCIEIIINPTSTFTNAIKLIPLVLFFHFFVNRGISQVTLKKVALFMSRYICLTSLITLLGIIEPIQEYRDAARFGIEGLSYYSSLFGAPHAASSYFAIAIIVLFYFIIKREYSSKLWMAFDIVMIIIAFLSIYQSFVRTGWFMLCIGLLFLMGITNILKKPKYLLLFFISVGLLYQLYNYNEKVKARMSGVNVYRGIEGQNIETEGSGRTLFWKNGLELWSSGSPYEILFGQGYTSVINNNYKKLGMEVFSHNQFIDILAQHGIIGLIILILVFLYQYKYIRKREQSPYYRLCLSIFMMTIFFSFFQGVMYFDYAIIYATCLALLVKDVKLKES